MCVVLNFEAIKPKRVFPFDSGAFAGKIYPNFIQMMPLEEFECANDRDSVAKIIGTFFSTNRNYYTLSPRQKTSFDAEFDVGVLEEEIKALHKLTSVYTDRVDDRRFAIEMQSAEDVMLTPSNVLAVILPETYMESQVVRDYVIKKLKATLITYPVFPLRKDYYYYAIYEKVYSFLRDGNYFNV